MPAGPTLEPISTTTLGSTQSTVTLSSFAGYTDLLIIITAARGITGSGEANLGVAVNGDTSSGLYSSTLYYEGGSTRTTNGVNYGFAGAVGDGAFLTNILRFQNYANSTNSKALMSKWMYSTGSGTGIIRFASGIWRNNSAITSITMTPPNGFAAGSTFTVYGIKAA